MFRVITDFDGPIMDVSNRYYCVYQLCLEKTQRQGQKINQLKKSEFWELKRACIPERKIAMMSGLDAQQAKEFVKIRQANVHGLDYLVHDLIIPGAIACLEILQEEGFDLVLMTMRKEKELEEAFKYYNLARFFPKEKRYCLSNNYVKSTDVQDKTKLMTKALKELSPVKDVWMIGDTEADIVAAKSNNIEVIAVLSGIRNHSRLQEYQPDMIFNNFSEALSMIIEVKNKLSIGCLV